MNRGEEDYIKALYEIETAQSDEDPVTNVQLAQYFSHTVQTVNEMVKKLAKKSMVAYIPYKGSKLTKEGREIAARMIRVHRIWETFLCDHLGYSWEEVHDEAECLEHMTTPLLEARLYSFLGEPKTCPHGNTIPLINEDPSDTPGIKLTDAKEQEQYALKRVVDEKALLTYLNQLEMHIGQKFTVERVDPVGEIVTIQIENRQIAIGFKVAMKLYITQH